MRLNVACFAVLIPLFLTSRLHAQTGDSTATSAISLTYADKATARIQSLDQKLDKRSAKVIAQFAKREEKLRRRLARDDSTAAKQIFSDAREKYNRLQQNLEQPGKLKQYIPYLDTLKTSFRFLQQNEQLVSGTKEVKAKLQSSLSKISGLEGQLQKAEDIKKFLKERKEFLKTQLSRFGFAKDLKKLNKEAYYYSQQLNEYKEILKDQQKIEKKAIELLSKTKFFKDFIARNGKLAEIFGIQGTPDPAYLQASFAGLQTRSLVNQLIQNQVAAGGPNAQQIIQSNIQQGQAQLAQVRNLLNKYGSSSSDDIMPEGFRPNPERSKSFFKRLELQTNIQSQRSNNLFPVTTDLGLGVGYKISNTGIIGVGASYKMGWGDNIQHIKITHQGVGLRSYIDWKIPSGGKVNILKTLWISGGYEQNYRAEIRNIDQLRNSSAWQSSGLIGISKKIPVQSKFLKGTRLQLLWDFLSYQQVPKAQPIVFRVGYNIK